jgi:hypothetical protein
MSNEKFLDLVEKLLFTLIFFWKNDTGPRKTWKRNMLYAVVIELVRIVESLKLAFCLIIYNIATVTNLLKDHS